jgi:hypothetical protein
MKVERMPDNPDPGTMLCREIMAVCRRFGQESDVTAYQTIGALEMAKNAIIEGLKQNQQEDLGQ